MVEHIVSRKEIYDPSIEEFVKEELPTFSIKRTEKIKNVSPGTLMTYYSTGPGSVIRITRLEFSADREAEFFVRDREGTVGFYFLEAAGQVHLLGAPTSPVMILKGTCQFRNIGTQLQAGTFTCNVEGIPRQHGTETVS